MNFPATAPCTYVRFVFSKTPLYGKTAEFTAVFWSEKSSQVKFANYLTVGRNGFTESRFSEQERRCAETCGITRFSAKPHGAEKSIGVTCEQDIITAILSGFDDNRIFHDIAKRMRWRAYPLRCFHNEKLEVFMNVRNEIKAQIVRAGFTMQEVVDRLADEYDWSDSVSNLSAKLQRESIRYKEVMELADVLDCDIVWVKRGDRR